MFNIILQGLFTGIILTFSFGAGFFALIQTSISRGVKKGIMISVGSIISDSMYIYFSLFATSFISNELPKYKYPIKLAGLVNLHQTQAPNAISTIFQKVSCLIQSIQ